jgi:hypothetical protein
MTSSVLASAVVGTGVSESLAVRGKVRVVVSFRSVESIADQRTRVLNSLDSRDFVEIRRWDFVPALALELTPAALPKLAASGDVAHIDLDIGGSGIGVKSTGLAGLSRVAVLDAGLPPDRNSSEAVDEQCFCQRADGSGCCPDGSAEQSGAGSSNSTVRSVSTSTEFLADRPMLRPEHAPERHRILAVKVLDERNRFSSMVPILSAVDWLIAHEPESRTIVLSFATDGLFCGECAEQNANTQALFRGLESLRARGVSIYAPGISAPACLRGVHAAAKAGSFTGYVPASVRPSSGPVAPGPVAPNESVAVALVRSKSIIPADSVPDELPMARVSVVLRVEQSAAGTSGEPSFLVPPTTIEAYSLNDLPANLADERVKVVLTLAGDTRNSRWWIEELHPLQCKETQP